MARLPRLAKWILGAIGLSLCLILLYLANGYRQLKLQSAAAAHTRAELEIGYQKQLTAYRLALRIGMPRSDVLEYLRSRKIAYSEAKDEISVQLGRESDVFPCDSWMVYISLKFGHIGPVDESSPGDPLNSISLQKIGHCL